jgi:beta-mannosidase
VGNTASIGIIERNLAIFDPTRMFLRTSPDEGSLHSYPDFDPVWYKGFDLIPYIAETGIHCITDSRNIREVVSSKELDNLSRMYEKTFVVNHPEFVEHFAEYNPHRVPRMLSRASHIDDMSSPDIETISEATQIGAGEFYQVMSEGFQKNYPVTTGLMPWVYKRPWPVVAAINLVDGYGHPSATYYFLKRTYEPTHVSVDIRRLLWKPGESFPVSPYVLNAVNQSSFDAKVYVEVMNDNFEILWNKDKEVKVAAGVSVTSVDLGDFIIPDSYREKYFFVVVKLFSGDKLVSQTEYWPRTLALIEDPEFYNKYTSEPVAWPTLDKGPWLKPSVGIRKNTTSLQVSNVKCSGLKDSQAIISFEVKNTGKKPSFMTTFDFEGCSRSFFSNDNYFWLNPGETRNIDVELLIRDAKPPGSIRLDIKSWNSKIVSKSISL